MRWYWPLVAAAIGVRLALLCFADSLNLAFRPEVATPLTSLRRLAEGYWLKQSSMSPYAGSMYHGSPLLLPILGPLTIKRIEGKPGHLLCSFMFVIVDFVTAMLIRAIGQRLRLTGYPNLKPVNLKKLVESSYISSFSEWTKVDGHCGLTVELLLISRHHHYEIMSIFFCTSVLILGTVLLRDALDHRYVPAFMVNGGTINTGDIASLIYLWNPMTIVTCVGSSTSPIDNMMVVLAIYGACSSLAPLAAFGWVMATHFSLYPAVLVLPVILLLGYGPDGPPPKLFRKNESKACASNSSEKTHEHDTIDQTVLMVHSFSWKPVAQFILWASIWALYILLLSSMSLKEHGGLSVMLEKTYGFILTVKDLSPNIGVLWYFFAEVFLFFRVFFLIVFNVNILFMVLPLAIRLKHRPCFLAFVYITIYSMLKSYPSIGDSALYLGLLGLFANELADMHFSFFLFCGYIGVSLLSAVMHNLWIWRGTGNANFYFATGIAYACLQIVLVVESVSTMLKHDRMLSKQLTT